MYNHTNDILLHNTLTDLLYFILTRCEGNRKIRPRLEGKYTTNPSYVESQLHCFTSITDVGVYIVTLLFCNKFSECLCCVDLRI